MTDEPYQRSASLTEVVAVRGGGIPLDGPLSTAWLLTPEEIEGLRFVDISIASYRYQKYFAGRFYMLNHLKTLRDAKTAEAMQAAACVRPQQIGREPLRTKHTELSQAGTH